MDDWVIYFSISVAVAVLIICVQRLRRKAKQKAIFSGEKKRKVE